MSGWGGGAAQLETRTAPTISGCHPPGSQHLEPRPHACHARTQTRSHRHTQPGAQTPPAAPPRPLRAPPPALTAPQAARPRWLEAAASGRFDFPAARAPRSRSPSRGGGARSRVPSPAAAHAETQQEAVGPGAPGSKLPAASHPRCLRPTGPHAPFLSCTPSASARICTRPSRRPRPAPLRLAPLRPSSPGVSPLSVGPPASSSRPPYPTPQIRGPRSRRPPSLPHFPRPLFELLSLLPVPPSLGSRVGGEPRVSVAPEKA